MNPTKSSRTAEIWQLYEFGLGKTAIARKLGIDRSTVYWHLGLPNPNKEGDGPTSQSPDTNEPSETMARDAVQSIVADSEDVTRDEPSGHRPKDRVA